MNGDHFKHEFKAPTSVSKQAKLRKNKDVNKKLNTEMGFTCNKTFNTY